ncbi:MauE/DoxX family redox-associated membrane protein [Gimesia aquarii]|uniref:Vitamin K-dependent gamma-carboxylase n=1 Tax=Gimesia aquarii TaxID=2527964 RepID=A0A517X3W3_9PLAN|nr:MauE/DoxX family redox-associated membrane protein [Gimesia aquarii]QDU12201.1 hypothetical protein V202x_56260 [Gimesia aquarii]
MSSSNSQSPSSKMLHLQLRFLKINLAFFSLALLMTTWELWVPQTLFPQVPLFSWILALPTWSDWMTFGFMLISSAGMLGIVLGSVIFQVQNRELWQLCQRVCSGLFFWAFLISITFDQHRIQPWAYQFALGFLILMFLKPPRAIRVFRFFVISIYFYSAFSKCDLSFVQTLGRQLVEGLFLAIGISTEYWSDQTLSWIAASFPVAEFLIALGLLIPRTRQWAFWGAVSMHVCLIIAVGPWGLDHHQGVLIWNAYFILQDCFLFHKRFNGVPVLKKKGPADSNSINTDQSISFKSVVGWERAVMVIAWFAMLAPLFEPTGYYDHWPAWGLYASHHDRVTLLIDEDAKLDLPSSLRPFVGPPEPFSRWCRVRVDRWSLAELGVPVYPQARFQLGVAIAVGRTLEHEKQKSNDLPQIKLLLEGAANRLTGKRKMNDYTGLKQVEKLTNRFWFNALPRQFEIDEESNLFD